MARVFVGVGSNIDPAENVPAALRLLAKEVRVVATSLFYETLPLGRPEQPAFYNGVVEIATDLPPDDLRQLLRRIETQLGRRRSRDPYAARTIDLDLLLYGTPLPCPSAGGVGAGPPALRAATSPARNRRDSSSSGYEAARGIDPAVEKGDRKWTGPRLNALSANC